MKQLFPAFITPRAQIHNLSPDQNGLVNGGININGDALHLAIASYHKIDSVLTWNCKHIANANKMEPSNKFPNWIVNSHISNTV
ncbi:hypothetical protein THIOM_004769 [Candidatus Thiomargarita nelsonii]|uniref:PIN domain-containing protein n=1 Tax=Candidatus Thiomargarita nelsonii TaxID=1003181 RepID=A0A176RV40_9GAMM|nr:hypothetical protein THIOM_004769 [Candidatus Thiomargarita nelsonii]